MSPGGLAVLVCALLFLGVGGCGPVCGFCFSPEGWGKRRLPPFPHPCRGCPCHATPSPAMPRPATPRPAKPRRRFLRKRFDVLHLVPAVLSRFFGSPVPNPDPASPNVQPSQQLVAVYQLGIGLDEDRGGPLVEPGPGT